MVEHGKTDGYKFAVTVLTAIASILYVIYTYFQNMPLDEDLYFHICGLVAVTLILILGFVFYLLIKGYSMEVQDDSHAKYLNKMASYFYVGSLLLFLWLIVNVVCFFYVVYCLKSESGMLNAVISFSISSITIILFILPSLKNKDWTDFERAKFEPSVIKSKFYLAYITFLRLKLHKINILFIQRLSALLLIGFIMWIFLFVLVLGSPLQGHVTIDMESIYYKNDAQIPVLIQVTGPNTDLFVVLYKKIYGNLSEISFIGPIEPTFSGPKRDLEVISNNRLVGNSLSNGNYNVFINTTNLTTGYYELMCIRESYWKTYEVKGFYLLNNS